MLAAVNGVLLAGDLLTMFIFLEIAALSAYSLVAFGGESRRLEAAFKYFILGEVASVMILIAVALIFSATGTFDLAQISYLFPAAATVVKSAVAILLLTGLGMKAALVPFHAWLPDAHTAAPSPVSAMLSGVIIKVLGVYVIARLFYNVLGLTWQVALALTILGGVSILFGGFLAIGQRDIKRLMAYSSISQIGYILVGFGLATPLGIMGAVFHLFNHVFMKSLLFLDAGAIEKATGTRDLEALGGLSRKMPATSFTTLVGSLAISGLPPFNGFWSKLFIILACLQAGWLWLALAAIIGTILTLAAFLNVMQKVFFGEGREQGRAREVPWPMVTATVFLAVACLGIGLAYPYLLQTIINPAVVALLSGAGYGRMIAGAL
jgi:multicomponent Na+:H+ antiporter subunit D